MTIEIYYNIHTMEVTSCTKAVHSLSITLAKLRELILYVRTFWPVNSGNPSLFQYGNQLQSLCRQCQKWGHHYWILDSKMYLASDYRDSANHQTIKLKNVDTQLQSVGTDLDTITNGIQRIYQAILPHETPCPHMTPTPQPTPCPPCHPSIQHLFNSINSNLLHNSFSEILKKSARQLAILLLQTQTKLSVFPKMIQSAFQICPDITHYPLLHRKFANLWKHVRVVESEHPATVREQICRLRKLMIITTSAVVVENRAKDVGGLLGKIVFGLSFPYFWIADQEAELLCYKLWRNPKVHDLNDVWNLPQRGAIKQCKKMVFQSIKTSTFIYIPLSYLQSQKTPTCILTQPQTSTIRTSVLYHSNLNNSRQCSQYSPFSWMQNISDTEINTIVIHFHGGGFVALSSQTMQSYTRKWANQLQVPVFSVDYRKAPGGMFPLALMDSLTAYVFIVDNIHKYFNIRPTNIILAGDSAGGNLAVSLQALLMQRKYPILPSGIFLAYPAVDLRIRYSPSRLNSINDPILIPPLLFLCLEEYLGPNPTAHSHPLASPILLTDTYIKTGQMKEGEDKWPEGWPKTVIMVGKKDPLYDDSLRLLDRIVGSGGQAKLVVYREFSHAFLSLDQMVPECARTIDDAIVELRNLINSYS